MSAASQLVLGQAGKEAFDWRFAPNIDPATRAEADRTGKFSSYRLLDDFGTHTVTAGTTIQTAAEHAGRVPTSATYMEDVEADAILITVIHAPTDPISSGGPENADITPDDYEPWHGVLNLSQNNIDE